MRSRLRLAVRALAASLLLGAVGAFLAPEIAVRRATDRARVCLARVEAPRTKALPDCAGIIRDFDFSSGVFYTKHDATYRAEELYARVGVVRYEDAIIGAPSRERRREAVARVAAAEDLLERGSRRVSMEELGPAIGAPNVGKLAVRYGDRDALLADPQRFGLWTVRKRVLEAALLEAEFDDAVAIADRYAEWDPRDADLRTAVGAVLCLSDPLRGSSLLERVPVDRADKRYANIQRNFGEVMWLWRACAKKAGLSDPAPPSESSAGEYDERARRFIFDLARLGRSDAGAAAYELLASTVGARTAGDERLLVALLAAAAASDAPVSPAELRPLFALGAPKALTLRELADESRRSDPGLAPSVYEAAAQRLSALALTQSEATDRQGIATLVAWLRREQARAHAALGTVDLAVRSARAAAEKDERAGASEVAAGSIAFVAGDAGLARDLLAGQAEVDPSLAAERLTALMLAQATLGEIEAARLAVPKLRALADAPATARVSAIHARLTALALDALPEQPAAAPPGLPWIGLADRQQRFAEQPEEVALASLEALRTALGASSEQRRAFRYRWLELRGDLAPMPLPQLVASARLLDDDTMGDGVEVYLDAVLSADQVRYRLRDVARYRMQAAEVRGDAIHAFVWRERLRRLRELAADPENFEIATFLGI